MSKYYTGVGSRETPSKVQEQMTGIATDLVRQGFTLRSGGADGADYAFEEGCQGNAEIYLPWPDFNDCIGDIYIALNELNLALVQEAESMAKSIHPAWDRLSQGAQKLHTRNIFQVLGRDLKTPSKLLICYAQPQGKSVKGGTRTAVELALRCRIPVINLYNDFENGD